MGKLYIFAIGGTGSRVVKSLAMLLASGVKVNAEAVVPIIIDPDENNGDLLRTIDILEKYQDIRKKINFKNNNFFFTKITTLDQISANDDSAVQPNFIFKLNDVSSLKFEDYIDFTNLSPQNKALIKALFSAENLDADMSVGFKGNPNMGSVVLNQMKETEEFKTFVSNFNDGDRIFIISSIFGGTGAAGFPLLVKNLRDAESIKGLEDNGALLSKSKIGAVCVLPYFGVKPSESSKINKATFISKAKAALSYYEQNLTGNNSLNALYYIGDTVKNEYENHEGSKSQKNNAHFIELAAALSIVDFMNIHNDNLEINDNKQAIKPFYKEFGIKGEEHNTLYFSTLGQNTINLIMKPLTQMMLFHLYNVMRLDKSVEKQPWSTGGAIKLDKDNFFTKDYYQNKIVPFFNYFDEWIEELNRNEIYFSPFELDVNEKNLYRLINAAHIKKPTYYEKIKYGLFPPFAYYDDLLNKYGKEFSDESVQRKFFDIFYNTTQQLVKEKYQTNSK